MGRCADRDDFEAIGIGRAVRRRNRLGSAASARSIGDPPTAP